eukprot:12970224-Heterocapsa_arctica.AAC.1
MRSGGETAKALQQHFVCMTARAPYCRRRRWKTSISAWTSGNLAPRPGRREGAEGVRANHCTGM